MAAPSVMEKKVYCSYEGERNQRHLERSRMNWAIGGGERERRRDRNQEAERPSSQNGWVIEEEKLGEGREAQELVKFTVGGRRGVSAWEPV